MKVIEILFCRLLLAGIFFQSDMGRTIEAQPPQGWRNDFLNQLTNGDGGFIESTCFSNIFWMKLDKSFLENKFYSVEIIGPSGVIIPITETLKARCGYILTSDVWGNTIFRASFLGCHVLNEMDEKFYLNVNIRVSLFQDLGAATNYRHSMHCTYSPWAPREIICEENYMEVSVKSDIPVISDDETAEWMSALPEAQKVAYQIWQLTFYSPSGRKTIAVSDADKLGYSFNNTLTRVFLRSPYYTNETEQSVVNGVTMSTVSSTSMYRQRWLLLLIDTTVSCPVGGTSFTDATITWTVPSIIPRLVLQKSTFTSLNIAMGVDGQRMMNPEELNYILEHNSTHIGITIPIGEYGGRFQSTVSDGVHGVIYSIDLSLEHAWKDTDWQLTKYTVIKPITTPFIPRIPTVFDNTVPETRLFDITLGAFLPDVTLVTLTIGGLPLYPKEAEQKGYKISDTSFPNGTKGFNLVVPFDDPNVLKEYVNRNETKYHLHVNYTMNVGPEQRIYHHPADIEYILADIELPESVGYCDVANMYLAVPITNFYQHWSLYVGNKPLNQATALANGCLLTINSTHLVLQVPLFAVGIIYEEVSFDGIQARFDLALKKTSTLETLDIFSVRCSFRTSEFVVCYPNGTVTVSALMRTVPSIDMGKTRLKDNRCKPIVSTKEQVLFQFHVSACGTSFRFEAEHLIYENEIFFEKETLPAQEPPIITRDPEYRITILCYYPVKDTLTQSVVFYGSSSPGASPPFGYGTMMTRSNSAGLRRLRHVLNVIANVFKDKYFMDTYVPHSRTVVYSWEPIFLEFELKDEVPDMELFLDNCWITGSEEFNSIPQWNIIEDGCVNKSSGLVSFYPITISERVKYPSHFKRVKIQMLTFPLKKVFFHCTVTAGSCLRAHDDGLSCKRCLLREMHGQNFGIHPIRHGYIIAGPVSIIHPDHIQEISKQIRYNHTA